MANNVSIAKAKKGDTVMLCMFTGMRVGPKEIVSCDKETVTINRNHKGEVTFDRKTGKQISPMPKAEKFASYITEDDGTYVHPTKKKAKAKTKKASTKRAKAVEEEDEVEEEAPKSRKKRAKTEEEEAPAPKKATKKKAAKRKPEPEPEEDEDEDDDFDDDDFEEVE